MKILCHSYFEYQIRMVKYCPSGSISTLIYSLSTHTCSFITFLFCFLYAGRIRNIHFLFFLDSDTALSVASEMVEQLELVDQNDIFIAELIDLLLLSLIPSWKPCVPIDHLVPPNRRQVSSGYQYSKPQEYGKTSSGSFQHTCEAGDGSRSKVCPDASTLGGSDESTVPGPSSMKFNGKMSHANFCIEDSGSEMSYVSTTSIEWNDKISSSIHSFMSAELGPLYTGHHGFKGSLKTSLCGEELYFDAKSKCMNPVSSSPDEDEELRLELEMIELQYQEAMKEISKRRHEAIMDTRKRLSQKKMQSVY